MRADGTSSVPRSGGISYPSGHAQIGQRESKGPCRPVRTHSMPPGLTPLNETQSRPESAICVYEPNMLDCYQDHFPTSANSVPICFLCHRDVNHWFNGILGDRSPISFSFSSSVSNDTYFRRVRRHLSSPGDDAVPAMLKVGGSEHGAPSKFAGLGIDRIKMGTQPTRPADPGRNGRQL